MQGCVNFYCTSAIIHAHIYIYAHIRSFYILHYGLSQDIEYSSLYYTVRPCCSSILYIFSLHILTPNSQSTTPPLPVYIFYLILFFFIYFRLSHSHYDSSLLQLSSPKNKYILLYNYNSIIYIQEI